MKTILILFTLLLQAPAPTTYSISGRVVRFPGAPVTPSMQLMLRSYALNEGPGQGRTTTIHADGTFDFKDVLPGECDLILSNDRQPIQPVGRNFTFSGHNVTGLEIKAPAALSVRFIMANGGPAPAVVVTASTPLSINSSFRSGRSMWAQAIRGSDGPVTLRVFPGENTIAVGASGGMPGSQALPSGYKVKSITYGDVDVVAHGLVLAELPTSTLVITLDR